MTNNNNLDLKCKCICTEDALYNAVSNIFKDIRINNKNISKTEEYKLLYSKFIAFLTKNG